MQMGFYFDQTRCIGCYNCVAACRSWNELDPQDPDLIQILSEEKGAFPHVSLSHLFMTCFHCTEPGCLSACPEELIVKRPQDGLVMITDPESCTGCNLCLDHCPYGALKIVKGENPKIIKCHMCLDRLAGGKAPACVGACPTEALNAGMMGKLMEKYGDLREIENFPDYRQTKPSIVFRSAGAK